MLQDRDQDIKKMMDCFMKLSLSREQLAMVESYLEGEIGEEELDRIPFTDLSQYTGLESFAFQKVMDGFARQKKREAMKLFFNAQFAIGHTTSHVFFGWYQWLEEDGKENIELNGVAPGKICAVAAEYFTTDVYRAYQWLRKFADQDPQNLLRAIEYHKEQSNQCRILLFYCYFLMKYPQGNAEHCPESTAHCSGQSMIYSGDGEGAAGWNLSWGVQQEDRERLHYFEEMLLDGLDDLFRGNIDGTVIAQMKEEVRVGRRADARSRVPLGIQLSMAQTHLLPLMGGCAYANFRLSGVLKQIVELYLIADTEKMLCVMSAMDTNEEMKDRGGDFDRMFGIDPVKLILWAADRDEKSILRMRFARDREGYMTLLDEVDYVRSIVMRSVVEEHDKALYEAFLKRHREVYRENIVSMLVDDNGAVKQQTRAYLEGREPIGTLCSMSSKISEKHFLAACREMETLEDFRRLYGDEAFYRRCKVYLLLLRGTSWQFFDEKIRKNRKFYDGKAWKDNEPVRQIFRDCSQENMTFSCQLDGAVMIVEHSNMSQKEEFFHKVKYVFADYLKENRKEMVEAFRKACVEGRYLGLMTYQIDAETYKEELFGFAKDTAKTVREKLVEVLCGHKEWEAEIRKLQQSARKAERMLANRVLEEWDKAEGKCRHEECIGQGR